MEKSRRTAAPFAFPPVARPNTDPHRDAAPARPDALPAGLAAVLPFLYVAWADGRLDGGRGRRHPHARRRAAVAHGRRARARSRPTSTRPRRPTPRRSTAGRRRCGRRCPTCRPRRATRSPPWARRSRRSRQLRSGASVSGDGGSAARTPTSAPRSTRSSARSASTGPRRSARWRRPRPTPARPRSRRPSRPPSTSPRCRPSSTAPRAAVRDRVRELLAGPGVRLPRAVDLEGGLPRARPGVDCSAWPTPAWAGSPSRASVGGGGSIGDFIAAFETIAFHDLSLVVKYGVQFGLWGGSVAQLGGDAQKRARLLPEIGSLRLPGAFAMSERAHGSNVRDLQTTATLDRATRRVGHPDADRARPQGVDRQRGGARAHGDRLRAARHRRRELRRPRLPRAAPRRRRATSCPASASRTRATRWASTASTTAASGSTPSASRATNLLDRFAQVSADGTYSSPIASEGKRFFVMLGTLVGGRIAVGSAANSAARAGLTIAVRYGARRRQFGPSGGARGAAHGLPQPPAPPAAARGHEHGPHVRAPRPRRALRGPARGRRHARDRVRRSRAQVARVVAQHARAPGGPRGDRRRGLPLDVPHRAPQGRRRHLHDLRGRQHGPDAPGREGPAGRLPARVLGPQRLRHRALPARPRRRAPGRGQPGPAPQRRPRTTCSTPTGTAPSSSAASAS